LSHRSIGTTFFNVLFGGSNMRLNEKIQELIESEWITAFQESRSELQENAKVNIRNSVKMLKALEREKKLTAKVSYAIKKTQTSPGSKFPLILIAY